MLSRLADTRASIGVKGEYMEGSTAWVNLMRTTLQLRGVLWKGEQSNVTWQGREGSGGENQTKDTPRGLEAIQPQKCLITPIPRFRSHAASRAPLLYLMLFTSQYALVRLL